MKRISNYMRTLWEEKIFSPIKQNIKNVEVIYIALFVCFNILHWMALFAGDSVHFRSRDGFVLIRYLGSVAYVVIVVAMARISPLVKNWKVRTYMISYWAISTFISFCALFTIGTWYPETTAMYSPLLTLLFTLWVTPFGALFPSVFLVADTVTTLQWAQISDVNIVVSFVFSVIQLVWVIRSELKLYQTRKLALDSDVCHIEQTTKTKGSTN